MNTFTITFLTKQGWITTQDFKFQMHSVQTVIEWWDSNMDIKIKSITKH